MQISVKIAQRALIRKWSHGLVTSGKKSQVFPKHRSGNTTVRSAKPKAERFQLFGTKNV